MTAWQSSKGESERLMKIDEIRALVEILEHSSLNFMDIAEGNFHLLMGKSAPQGAGTDTCGDGSVAGGEIAGRTSVSSEESMQLTERLVAQAARQAEQYGGEAGGQPGVGVSHAEQSSGSSGQPSGTAVKSPMVGVFYRASSPEAEPFVSVGQQVKKGQVLCIIEAMKLMNEISAERDGQITQVCVKDGDIVEYGQPLFYIG